MSHDYFAHPSAFIDSGAQIGSDTHIWHFCHIMSHAVIGISCVLGQNVFVANHVSIGNYVKIQNNVSIYEGVSLEDYVFLGPSMVFTNVMTPRSAFPRNNSSYFKSTVVKYGASVGANATIICGTTLGKWSFIGAGAVVTGDVPAYALMLGVPARQVGWVGQHGVRLMQPDLDGIMKCPESGWKYRMVASETLERVE